MINIKHCVINAGVKGINNGKEKGREFSWLK